MSRVTNKTEKRIRRHKRIRAKIKGTAVIPRLAVFRSNKYIYAQLVDDVSGTTIASVSSLAKKGEKKKITAKAVGSQIAERAKSAKIKKVVFDRSGFLYAGKIKAVAEGAREGGLDF
ncbi:MAG TPA: 50S ribosomal protein L18 [Candidatus Paceibacterota bacterium]